MMLYKGKHEGVRVLSRPSVEMMTTDQLTLGQKTASGMFTGPFGWGFGLSVVLRRDFPMGIGTFGWSGGMGTCWYTDPSEEMTTILMTQTAWTSPQPPNVCLDFWALAYSAIDD
jgi:CubicO group peptidase (beta-lactamase class C family)